MARSTPASGFKLFRLRVAEHTKVMEGVRVVPLGCGLNAAFPTNGPVALCLGSMFPYWSFRLEDIDSTVHYSTCSGSHSHMTLSIAERQPSAGLSQNL
jgi:hypothetical protein